MPSPQYRYVFFGTPELAATALEALHAFNLAPSLIVTTPAKPQGRGLKLTSSPVAIWAETHNIECLTPERITPEVTADIARRGPWDFYLVVAYGKILRQSLIDSVGGRVINIHPSLLPKYRGPSPLESVLLSDDTETGVTIMQIDSLVDHGPVITQQAFPLPQSMVRPELETKSAQIGAMLIAAALPDYLSGVTPKEQDHDQATFTHKITKTHGNLDGIENDWEKWKRYRAFIGWPGTYFTATRRRTSVRVKISRARYENNSFIIEEVVPENMKAMSYDIFQTWLAS